MARSGLPCSLLAARVITPKRQADLEQGAAAGCIADRHAAVVSSDDILDEIETQSAALIEGEDAVERFEDRLGICSGMPGPLSDTRTEPSRPTATRIMLLRPLWIMAFWIRFTRARESDAKSADTVTISTSVSNENLVACGDREGSHVGGDLGRELDQVDGLKDRPVGIDPLQVEQLVREVGEAGDIEH